MAVLVAWLKAVRAFAIDVGDTLKGFAGVAKDFAASFKDVCISIAVIGIAGWLVLGSKPSDWANITVGKDGLNFVHAIREVKEGAAASANRQEQVRSDVVSLQSRIDSIGDDFKAYKASKTDSNLNKLENTIRGTKTAADLTSSNAAASSSDTARTLLQIDDIASTVAEATGTKLPAGATHTGWIYLGKISKDRRTWLSSSASGTSAFTPPLQEGADILQQIKPNQTEIQSVGYKYLRSTDSAAGRRLDGAIVRTLPPNTPLKILSIDDTGIDRADGQAVVWALVQVLR